MIIKQVTYKLCLLRKLRGVDIVVGLSKEVSCVEEIIFARSIARYL